MRKSLKLKLLLLGGILSFGQISKAQVADTGQILTRITTIINNMPNDTSGNDFIPPSASQLTTWSNIIDLLLDGDYSEAEDSAAVLDYDLVAFYDTTINPKITLYMLKSAGTNYWGTYIMNPSFSRPLVIQSAHPRFDFNTGKQGIYAFRRTNAFFFMMSGTHRCNSSSHSTCDGTTDVCGANQAFRKSDVAHFDSSLFHVATEKLFDAYSGLYFIQLHGFTKGGADPFVIMSNGTRKKPTIDYLDTLKERLLDEDNSLTFKLMHVDTTWTKLAGLTNIQGRYINGSSDPCGTAATATNGRFLHLEQERNKFRSTEAGWLMMSDALTATFPVGPLPIKLLSFEARHTNMGNRINWVTASESNNALFELQRYDHHQWQTIHTVSGAGFSNTKKSYSFMDANPNLNTTYYRLRQIDFDGNFTISHAISVDQHMRSKDLHLTPNPTTDHVYVQLPNEEKSVITVLNSFGVVMLTEENQNQSYDLDLTRMASGAYFIQIQQGSKVYVERILKH